MRFDLAVRYKSLSRQMLERGKVREGATTMGRVEGILVKGEMLAAW